MNILITGGAQGLGKIISENLIKQNHQLIILDRFEKNKVNSDYLEKIDYYEIDLMDFLIVDKILNEIITKYHKIDVVINNAALREFLSFEEFSADDVVKNVNVNFIAPMLLIKKLLPLMIKNNFGRFINISSISGLQGYSKGSLYCSTKSALIIFTEAFAYDLLKLNKNITANAILPDSFQTREGEKLKNYDYIISKITKMINEFINSNANGVIQVISPPYKKVIELLKAFYFQYRRFF